ncbi:MAG: glycosyltransferase family 4 protein [Chloroflexi bacterium]|nr:glycosyltransferase family 4 protein [Chloroflexota bacterium]
MRAGIAGHLLHFGHSYRAAGISRYIGELVPRLADEEGIDLTVFLGPAGEQHRAAMGSARVRVTRLPTDRPLARIAWEQALAGAIALAQRLDLFHGPAYALPIALPVPAIVTFHDLSFERYPAMFPRGNRMYLRLAARVAVRQARRVVADSHFTASEVAAILGVPRDRIDVVPLGLRAGIGPRDRTEVERFRAARDLPDRFILYLGTIEPRKDLITLLRAFARVHQEDPRVGLVIAGGRGWQEGSVFAEARRLDLGSAIRFVGFVPDEEQALWYNAATVFAYPSRYEGFGFPPLEAMACGTPVVCTGGSSLTELVADAAMTVPPGDAVALANALHGLLADATERERLGVAGIARAAAYTWRRTARETAATYRRALGAAA